MQQVICKYYAIFKKILENPWILLSVGVLKPIPNGYLGTTVFILLTIQPLVQRCNPKTSKKTKKKNPSDSTITISLEEAMEGFMFL